MSISKNTLKFFLDSGLTKKHAEKMEIRDVTDTEVRKIFPKFKFNSEKVDGHEIPYFDLSGKAISFKRYRLHSEDESLPKYLQVAGQKSRFYFPPFVNWNLAANDVSIPIYITEGERKAAKAAEMGYHCIGLGGVWNWTSKTKDDSSDYEHSQPIKDFQLISWKGRKVFIVFDSDSQFNSNIQSAIRKLRNTLVDLGADPFRIDLPHEVGKNKVGLDDFLKTKSGKKAFEKLPRIPLLLNKTMSGKDLLEMKCDSVQWLVKDLIPSGLTILAGPPKVGKSWLVLELVLAISAGKKALDHYSVEPTKCLYLALEDSPRRLKKRILSLQSCGYKVNDLSSFAYEWERVEDGGIAALERFLHSDPSYKVVFIDTFAKMRRAPNGRESLYHQDYEATSMLKRIADQRGIGIIIVHHTKKGISDDFLESVSGSMGITGAADTIIVLKRGRHDNEAVLNLTGRDVVEQAIALSFDNGAWTYKGEASEIIATETQNEILEALKAEGRPLRRKELADLTGRKNGGFGKTLARMVRDKLLMRDKHLMFHIVEPEPKKPLKFAPHSKDGEETS